MTDISCYLYVNYQPGGKIVDSDIDDVLGDDFQRCGSGFGLGGRDLEYLCDDDMDQEDLNALFIRMAAVLGTTDFNLGYDEWDEDDTSDSLIWLEANARTI